MPGGVARDGRGGDARDGRPGGFVPVGGPEERDSRAHAFAQGGVLDTAAPCPALAIVLDDVSGAEVPAAMIPAAACRGAA